MASAGRLDVTVGIAPWNAPPILGVRAVAMPLAYGNAVILKASEQTPGTQAEIARALHDAGVPAGAINLITNAAEDAAQIVERLVAHPSVRRINFTGSTCVGRLIGELAGKHLKRVVPELGERHRCSCFEMRSSTMPSTAPSLVRS